MERKYLLGALPSKVDVRDYVACAIPRVFPEEFILDMNPNYNQEFGTCVAQSARGVYREHFGIEFGTAFLYGGGRSHEQAGLYPNEAANFLCKYGLAPLSADPRELEVMEVISYYQSNRSRLEGVSAAYAGGRWGRASDANTIKAAVLDGLPVMFCAPISQWEVDSYGRFPCKSAVYGYHEMLVIGWEKVQGIDMAVVYNSWGNAWAKDGECFMYWEDVLQLSDVIVLTPPAKKEPENEEHNVIVRRTLKRGMKGEDVRLLQELLIACGYRGEIREANGTFGPRTETSVICYQEDCGIEADGIVGEETWTALESETPEDFDPLDDFIPSGMMREFILYLEEQARNHCIYVWGAQGQMGSAITERWITGRETSDTNAARAIAFWKKQVKAGFGDVLRAFDCSGLGMYFIQNLHKLSTSDRNAQGMRSFCTPIQRSELRAGDWVFRLNDEGKATHIGYIVDGSLSVIHAKGRDVGVVKEGLNANSSGYWEWYGRPTIFDDVPEPTPEPTERDLSLQDPMLRGDDVKALQTRLNALGYDCGTADGVFGSNTDKALRAYQKEALSMKLGICDAVARTILLL